ncbi:MAG: elongation factor G [Peptococcaceae bacterium]|nr:elongation factor G [Peptococcaceae bacterium]MBQ2035911.1 elongation factor G [Peptococcaceae bacterium]MBQ2449322.1 elongation factor G [Peptococcaceae bacterium]MBQ5653120.1 elongation factor G [Peptococcaceae bacterium]MBQ5683303.1 elongation factor G [Peptococcaceae bacterium]
MQVYQTGDIRNIGIAGHSGSGKTSLLETMLFNTGVTNRLGKVEDGTTVTDYLPEEIKRQVTISASLAPVEWNGTKLNMIDTPGYADFIGEVISTTRAVDNMLMVVCGVAGIEVQTEVIWDIAANNKLPRVIFINKLERENSCFETVVEAMRAKYGTGIVPLQLPMGKEANFVGMIDLLNEKAYKFEEGKSVEIPIPEEFMEDYESQRTYLIEVAAESCDELLLKYLEGEIPTNKEIRSALRMGIANGEIFPVVGGSVAKNMGLDVMMDVLVDLLPVPTVNAQAPASAIVFKTLADPFVGKLSFLKVIDGQFNAGDGIYNVNNDVEEKVGSFIIPCGKQQSTVTTVNAGDIVAIAKLQNTQTSNTLTVKGQSVPELAPIKFPAPNLTFALSPKSRDDDDKMSNALGRLLEEDPTLTLEKNAETHETLLSGVGETHLEVVAERFKNKFGVDVVLKPAQIPYRETIKKKVEVQGKHKKQSGGAGQYGDVWLRIEPCEEEFVFAEEVFGGAVPKNYFPAVEKGVREAMAQGILAGYPLGNIKVTLYDGSYHPVDSNEMAFKIAASTGFKNGAEQAGPVLLEPIMDMRITVPEAYMGDIMGDLNSKRGRIMGMEPSEDGKLQIILAQAPMSEVQKYVIDLKAMTQGRGKFTMTLDHYEEVPAKIAEKIIAERNA